MKKLLKLFVLGLLFVPTSTFAFSLQVAPEVNVNNEKIIEENLYILGGTVDFNKTFDDDLTIAGGNSNILGVLFGDMNVFLQM